MQIRLATMDDILDLVDHDLRHMREPGHDGQLAHPFPPDYPWDKEKRLTEKLNSFPKNIDEEGWQRSFIVTHDDLIVAHLNLKNNFEGMLHRAQLGMGIEAHYRGKGLGKKLLQFAIDWAKDQPTLEWIDLSVFAHNLPARKLYSSVGFEEIATYKDKIRVNGHSIDDVSMTLKLTK